MHRFRATYAGLKYTEFRIQNMDDRQARKKVSLLLGHNRVDVTYSYVPKDFRWDEYIPFVELEENHPWDEIPTRKEETGGEFRVEEPVQSSSPAEQGQPVGPSLRNEQFDRRKRRSPVQAEPKAGSRSRRASAQELENLIGKLNEVELDQALKLILQRIAESANTRC